MELCNKIITQKEPQATASFPGLKGKKGEIGEALRPLSSLFDSFVEHSYGQGTKPGPETQI